MQISANGIHIEVDDQGLPGGQPLLLIMGLGMQLIAWPQELVQLLVSRGFRVIRMDNRDAGLSQQFDALGTPNLAWAALRYALHMPVMSPYSLADMAADAVGVLDALAIPKAHICGASLGGMVAQHVAARHPARVESLALMMTTSGARHLPQGSLKVRAALLRRPANNTPQAAVERLEQVLALIGSPAYPPDAQALRQKLQTAVARAFRPSGTVRQLMAVVADGDRTPLLARISAPTCIIHGRDDPLVPLAAGQDLVSKIPGAVLDTVPGMGHDLPPQLLAQFAQALSHNAARAGR